jgi:hypothetical protein
VGSNPFFESLCRLATAFNKSSTGLFGHINRVALTVASDRQHPFNRAAAASPPPPPRRAAAWSLTHLKNPPNFERRFCKSEMLLKVGLKVLDTPLIHCNFTQGSKFLTGAHRGAMALFL